jgi:hypothetical protein
MAMFNLLGTTFFMPVNLKCFKWVKLRFSFPLLSIFVVGAG